MEKDIVKAIETAAPTSNKRNEDDIVPVEVVDEEERIQDGYGDGESATIRYRYNNKSQSGYLFFLREKTSPLSRH